MYGITAEKNRFVIGSLIITMTILMLSSMSSSSLIARETMRTPSATDPTTTVAPSTISQEGDFTAQAPLQIPRTFQSTDIVNSQGIYEVSFITSTAGAIDKIRMDFPESTNIAASGVIEKVGIGGGTLTKVDNTLIYDLQSPINVPPGTFIRLEISGIKNPTLPSNSLTITITTSDVGNVVIDGPSQTNAYKMKRIGTNELAVNAVTTQKIADGAITMTKPSESFMKRVTVSDTPTGGHIVGWNPDGATVTFTITEAAVAPGLQAFVSLFVSTGAPFTTNCETIQTPNIGGSFMMRCETAPPDGSQLQYMVANLPGHLIF